MPPSTRPRGARKPRIRIQKNAETGLTNSAAERTELLLSRLFSRLLGSQRAGTLGGMAAG